jgi:hypothetical protein
MHIISKIFLHFIVSDSIIKRLINQDDYENIIQIILLNQIKNYNYDYILLLDSLLLIGKRLQSVSKISLKKDTEISKRQLATILNSNTYLQFSKFVISHVNKLFSKFTNNSPELCKTLEIINIIYLKKYCNVLQTRNLNDIINALKTIYLTNDDSNLLNRTSKLLAILKIRLHS